MYVGDRGGGKEKNEWTGAGGQNEAVEAGVEVNNRIFALPRSMLGALHSYVQPLCDGGPPTGTRRDKGMGKGL